MNNFNTNLYETKREIINYSNKITEGLKKPTAKFIMDMLYGLSKNQSVMLSDISRALDENIKLNYTIDRLSKNLEKINDEELEIITIELYSMRLMKNHSYCLMIVKS